jgi:sugar transferase (PEP-CTERM/EpsH1 system associated)
LKPQAQVSEETPGHLIQVQQHLGGRQAFLPGRLRILHVFNYLGMGGTELTALRVITNLGHERFQSRLCGIRGFDPEIIASRCPDADVVTPLKQEAGFQIQIFPLMKLIKAFRPHIVHSRNWGSIEAVTAARLAGVPVVLHSEHGYELDNIDGVPFRRRLFRRFAYGLADAIFTVSGDLREYHARNGWISPDRIRVIPNGIDTNLFAPQPELRRAIRERAKLRPHCFVIGSVGRLVAIKDHTTLLKAANVLAQRGIDVHVLLAGAGPELIRHEEYLANSPALSSRVSFLGAADNVPEVMNALDAFVLPSISEGMSNTLIEAMSCALPVIATRVGGNPEVVQEDRSGWLFKPGDVADLAEKLERLARSQELRDGFGKCGRARAISNFSLEGMVKRYRQLYMELAENRGVKTGSPV